MEYKYDNDSLYLVFQMFSGDELHIVAKDMIFETASEYFMTGRENNESRINN